jgi:hypothetical protein
MKTLALCIPGKLASHRIAPVILALSCTLTALRAGGSLSDTNKPSAVLRAVFIHHSTGEAWLADDQGGLGKALRDNNYFVSDTNYGWGPDSIGDTTDIGHWWRWFRGPDSARYLAALFAESGQNCDYSRMGDAVAGPNRIVLFKSCFPNSALQGKPGDAIPAIAQNPLREQDASSDSHTVANAKGIYLDLLNYFGAMPDKLFVAITAPPLSDGTYASNARAFNRWLSEEWLAGYPHNNVFVWDFYNVLTSNSGGPEVSDLGLESGNHHRWWQGQVQYKTDGGGNTSAYPSAADDDHPNAAGDRKATAEFVPLLNAAVNAWLAAPTAPANPPCFTAVRLADQRCSLTLGSLVLGASYTVQRCPNLGSGDWTDAGSFVSQSELMIWSDPQPLTSQQMFYRVKSAGAL